MSRRTWLQKELDYLRAHLGRRSQAEIAQALGRSRRSITWAIAYYKLPTQKGRRRPVTWKRSLKGYHARGLTDSEIGRKLGFSPNTIASWRKELGLSANPVRLETYQRAHRTRLRNMDMDSLAEARWLRLRREKLDREKGFPDEREAS